MGFEGIPARPPIPPKAEKPPEPVVQPETPMAEVSQEIAPEEAQETATTEAAEVPLADAPVTESSQPAAEAVEKTAEEIELEKLNAELQAHIGAYRELMAQDQAITASLEAIRNDKKYEAKIKGGNVEDVLAALIPNKSIGIQNYKKIIAALPDDPYFRDRPMKVLRKLEEMTDEDVKNMSSSFNFQNMGIHAPRYDYVDYDNLAKVTGSEGVAIAMSQFNRSQKEIASIREQRDSNPDLIALEGQYKELNPKLEQENNAIIELQTKIKALENAKASATTAS